MRADQLRSAAESVAELLKRSDVLTSIRQCRDARDQNYRKAAANRLGQSAKIVLQGIQTLSNAEVTVLKALHLNSLASVDYWKSLISLAGDERARQSELVQLYSRVMFASSHLPNLTTLLSDVNSAQTSVRPGAGEGSLTVKLSDAGEKAADPDRIARAIDGIDMIYSACASLARKPAIDLQLLGISGHPDKNLSFFGDLEGTSAVYRVLDSIPGAIEEIDPDEETDIQELVEALPIFSDLSTLDKLGTFSRTDIRDITDTMRQGVLLSLESGVTLVEGPSKPDPNAGVQMLNKRANPAGHNAATSAGLAATTQAGNLQGKGAIKTTGKVGMNARPVNPEAGNTSALTNGQAGAPITADEQQDEYYQQYLAEREKLREKTNGAAGQEPEAGDRTSAMASLLRGLDRFKDR